MRVYHASGILSSYCDIPHIRPSIFTFCLFIYRSLRDRSLGPFGCLFEAVGKYQYLARGGIWTIVAAAMDLELSFQRSSFFW